MTINYLQSQLTLVVEIKQNKYTGCDVIQPNLFLSLWALGFKILHPHCLHLNTQHY